MLTVQNLHVYYGAIHAVKGVSLEDRFRWRRARSAR